MAGESSWSSVSLRELVESAVDGPFGSNLKTEHYQPGPGVRVVRLQNIGEGDFKDEDKAYVARAHAAKLRRHRVRCDDVIVASLGDERHPFGRACLYPCSIEEGIVKADCFRLRIDPTRATPGFVMLSLNSEHLRTSINGLGQGVTRDRINLGNLLGLSIPLAPLSEQRRIADILDTVDDAIRRTEQIIAKLEQVKQGLLHDLLTRGIDDNGELRDPVRHPEEFKDSPLGRIPKTWRLSTAETEFDIASGITLGPHRRPGSNPAPYLRVANVHRSKLELGDVSYLEASAAERLRIGLQKGDLLIVEGHANPAEIGRCAMATAKVVGFLFQNHLFRLRSRAMDRDFALAALNSRIARSYWRRVCSSSSGLNTINKTKLRQLPIVVPPISEQTTIAHKIRTMNERLIAEESDLAKLQLLKKGLMDDLLTGRVRVTPLLDEGEEAMS